jgi:hypothetical protein
LTCDINATAFVVWSKDIADAKANAMDVHMVDMEVLLKRSRRLEEDVLLAGILKSLFRIAMNSRLMVKRSPAPARSQRCIPVATSVKDQLCSPID